MVDQYRLQGMTKSFLQDLHPQPIMDTLCDLATFLDSATDRNALFATRLSLYKVTTLATNNNVLTENFQQERQLAHRSLHAAQEFLANLLANLPAANANATARSNHQDTVMTATQYRNNCRTEASSYDDKQEAIFGHVDLMCAQVVNPPEAMAAARATKDIRAMINLLAATLTLPLACISELDASLNTLVLQSPLNAQFTYVRLQSLVKFFRILVPNAPDMPALVFQEVFAGLLSRSNSPYGLLYGRMEEARGIAGISSLLTLESPLLITTLSTALQAKIAPPPRPRPTPAAADAEMEAPAADAAMEAEAEAEAAQEASANRAAGVDPLALALALAFSHPPLHLAASCAPRSAQPRTKAKTSSP